MSYTPTNWIDRSIQYENKYTMVQNQDGTVTLTPVTGTVYNEGTLINATNMNKIENELSTLDSGITSINANNTLWSGAWVMHANQTVQLSGNISEQTTGVVLVWSRYNTSTSQAINSGWNFTFIPKKFAQFGFSGKTVTQVMAGPAFSPVCCKNVTVNDNTIVGDATNDDTGTANGITYANNQFVLRYVIGV